MLEVNSFICPIHHNEKFDYRFCCDCRNYGTKMGYIYGTMHGRWCEMTSEERMKDIERAYEQVGKVCPDCKKERMLI